MDDVYTVIGLLLFGSFLFCLCCYKVSNLLYMLYHIDDNTPDEEPDFSSILMKEAGANPTGAAAQAAHPLAGELTPQAAQPVTAQPAPAPAPVAPAAARRSRSRRGRQGPTKTGYLDPDHFLEVIERMRKLRR